MKKKLNLKNLRVQSFVTSLEPANTENILGGATGLPACGATATVKNGCISDYLYSACRTCGIVCHDEM